MAAVQKLCCVCGDDVSAKKRVKDAKGQYYCELCQAKARGARPQRVEAAVGVAAGAGGAGGAMDLAPEKARGEPARTAPAASPVAAKPAADDGMLDLAPERDFVPKDQPMFGCATCKKLVPEKQIRNLDGEFICNSCFSKRNQAARPPAGKGGAKPASKPGAKGAVEEEVSKEETFAQTFKGGMLISAGVLAAGFGVFFAMLMYMPMVKEGGAFVAAVLSGVLTVYVIFRAGLLLISMIIAAKIMGGISFGYIGSALYKSLGLFVLLTAIDIYAASNETMKMISMGLGGILVLVSFLVLFRIDFFEAVILCVVNAVISFVMSFVMPILVLLAAVMILGHSGASMDDDEPAAPAHTAPANPGNGGGNGAMDGGGAVIGG